MLSAMLSERTQAVKTATRLLANHGLNPEEWHHYLTSMSDDGDSVLVYDNAAGDTLRIFPVGSRHEITRAADTARDVLAANPMLYGWEADDPYCRRIRLTS